MPVTPKDLWLNISDVRVHVIYMNRMVQKSIIRKFAEFCRFDLSDLIVIIYTVLIVPALTRKLRL